MEKSLRVRVEAVFHPKMSDLAIKLFLMGFCFRSFALFLVVFRFCFFFSYQISSRRYHSRNQCIPLKAMCHLIIILYLKDLWNKETLQANRIFTIHSLTIRGLLDLLCLLHTSNSVLKLSWSLSSSSRDFPFVCQSTDRKICPVIFSHMLTISVFWLWNLSNIKIFSVVLTVIMTAFRYFVISSLRNFLLGLLIKIYLGILWPHYSHY